MSEPTGEEEAQPAGGAGQVRLERLYLKDASFESPASPTIFREQWQPAVDLELNTRSQKVDANRYEVVLSITVTAKPEKVPRR